MSITLTTLAADCTEAQAELLAEVLERMEMTEEQAMSRFPGRNGWQILDKLMNIQRETQLAEMQSRPPSKSQVRLLEAFRDQAIVLGRTDISDQCNKTLVDFEGSMYTFSRALDVCQRFITLPNKEEREAQALTKAAGSNPLKDEEPF